MPNVDHMLPRRETHRQSLLLSFQFKMIPKVAQIGIRVCHVLRMCSIFFLLKVTQINAQYLDDRQDSWCHLESCRVKGLRPDVDNPYGEMSKLSREMTDKVT